jgi:transposase
MRRGEEVAVMDRVIIGVDPHKRSVTFEARDTREVLRVVGTLPTDRDGYRALLGVARQWPDRIWAIEGANGTGRPLAQRLLSDGERVLDVPAKLAARARVFDTGQGRKADATDAHAVVMVALRDAGAARAHHRRRAGGAVDAVRPPGRAVQGPDAGVEPDAPDADRTAPRRGADEEVGGPVPGDDGRGAARDQLGRTRRRLAADLLADLVQTETRLKTLKAELKQAVLARGSGLMTIYGIGPAGAARILRQPDR